MSASHRHYTAKQLMDADAAIWDRLHIQSGGQMYPWAGGSVALWSKYVQAVAMMLDRYGVSKSAPVPDSMRAEFEAENWHSLNQAIDQLGYGEGKRWGVEPEVFFATPEQRRLAERLSK